MFFFARLITTVSESDAEQPAMQVRRALKRSECVASWMLYATSVAVSEAPLWKVCPDATLSVHLEPSSVDHSLTTLGLTSKLLSTSTMFS